MELLGSCYFTEHPFMTKIAIFIRFKLSSYSWQIKVPLNLRDSCRQLRKD